MDPESHPHFDPRMGINKNKLLRPKRMTFQFVEEGKWSKEAEILKVKVLFAVFKLNLVTLVPFVPQKQCLFVSESIWRSRSERTTGEAGTIGEGKGRT